MVVPIAETVAVHDLNFRRVFILAVLTFIALC